MPSVILEALKKFFSPKDTVHKHWYSPLSDFEYVSSDFYTLIEKRLEARAVPGLQMSRVDFSEGGMLSDKRTYLRLKRERWVFDICAAPFGTSYFFSFRFLELPLGIKPMELFVFLVGLLLVFILAVKAFGLLSGPLTMLMVLVAIVWVMRNSVALGLLDMDASLMKTPVIGPLYELLIRKETYYREDTRLMYLSTVNSITEAIVEEVTAAKGVKLVKRFDRKAFLGDLYQESVSTPRKDQTPDPSA